MKIGARVRVGRRSGIGAGIKIGRSSRIGAGISLGKRKVSVGAGVRI